MDFTPLSPAWLADPYAGYAAIRSRTPSFRDETLDARVFTRHAECERILKDTTCFAADASRAGREIPVARKSIQTLDPPDNAALRKVVAASFRPGTQALDDQRLHDTVMAMLTRLRDERRVVDLVPEFSVPLCLSVICAVLGVEEPDPRWFEAVSERLVRGMDYGFRPEALEPSLQAREELSGLTRDWLANGDSAFLRAIGDARQGYPDEVVANTVRVILHAGYSSVSRLIENMLVLLIERPETFHAAAARLGTRRGRIIAVEEIMRYDGPVHAATRTVVAEVDLGGGRLAPGDVVIALLGSANRDERVFPDPDRLHLARDPNPHLGFGRGTHHCLGANLGVSLTAAVLGAFVSHFPEVTAAAPAVRRDNASLRGFAGIPVKLG